MAGGGGGGTFVSSDGRGRDGENRGCHGKARGRVRGSGMNEKYNNISNNNDGNKGDNNKGENNNNYDNKNDNKNHVIAP